MSDSFLDELPPGGVEYLEIYTPGEGAVAQLALDGAGRAEAAAESAEDDATQTGLDRIAAHEDRVQTGQDRTATAQDRAAAGISAGAASGSATTAGNAAGAALTSETNAIASAAAALADRLLTAAAVVTTTGDRLAASASEAAAAASVPATADRTVGRRLADTAIWTMVRSTSRWTISAAGVLEETAVDGFAWEFNPTTLAPLGVAFDQSDTNRILNPRGVGGTTGQLGAGGVMPPNTSVTSYDAGIVPTYLGFGVENGYPYIDVRITGTSGSSVVCRPTFSTGVETWALGEPITYVGAVKMIGGSLNGIGATLSLRQPALTGGVTSVSIAISGTKSLGSYTQVPTASATMALGVQYSMTITVGVAIDITLRLYAIQTYRRPYAPSAVFPPLAATGVSTRAQGTVTIPVAQLGARLSRRKGMLILDWCSQPGPFTSASDSDWLGLASIGDQTAANNLGLVINPAHPIEARLTVGGVVQTPSAVTITPPAGLTTLRTVVSWDLDAGYLQVSARGVAGSKVALVAMPPAITHLMIGRNATLHALAGAISGAEVRPGPLFDAAQSALAA